MTWDRRLYFPSQGRAGYGFFITHKSPRPSAGPEPAEESRGKHANHQTTEGSSIINTVPAYVEYFLFHL
jgi:hypothetical protein